MLGFRCLWSAKDLAVMAGLGALCLPLWLALIPHLEEGRQEARTRQAFNEVRRLQSEIADSSNANSAETPSVEPALKDTNVVARPSELDPWGQPYQLVAARTGNSRIIRVFSFGLDASSASEGLDPDDISSDMSVRPTKTFEDLRRRQWLIAFGVSGAAWFTASWLYCLAASRKDKHNSSSK